MFAYRNKRKRGFDTLNNRETLSYNLQHDDEFYSIKRSKSALKKSNSCKSNSRKSVQFNEVVLEVFDLINDDEQENIISEKPTCPKIVKSTLKNEKVYVPIRCSNTIFPKAIINDYNGEIINFEGNEDKEDKQKELKKDTKINSNYNEFPEILIIKENGRKSSTVLSNNNNNYNKDNEVTHIETSVSKQTSDVAKTVITSEANSEFNLINSNVLQKSNTLPRRARPSYKGHKRQSSVRLTCIY